MTNVDGFLAGEAIRLAECIKEPIRLPNAVQPHGVLLAVDPETFAIRYASQNSLDLLGADAVGLLGHSASVVTSDPMIDLVRATLANDDEVMEPIELELRGTRFDLIVTRSADHAFLEFEPQVGGDEAVNVPSLYAAMRRLARLDSKQELWDSVARELRTLLRFDRVMVYDFHPDEHGEVVAEERADDMEPYKGLHYPASDIPAQARELYLTKHSRVIADSSLRPSALVSASVEPLDLSIAELRSVSPHHLEFMHNMGQASTFSLSLVRGGRLVGMITCAHRTPRRLPFAARKALEVLADQVALQLGAMGDIVRLEKEAALRRVRDELVDGIHDASDLERALLRGGMSLLDLIPADGAAVCSGGIVATLGDTPDPSVILEFAKSQSISETVLHSVAFPSDFPSWATSFSHIAGVIISPIGADGDFIAWFRREVAQSVEWLGDLTVANRATTLSPRTSFSSWTESVTGRALSWEGLEAQADQLSREVQRSLSTARMAELALYDGLTGLPNRRMFMDKLEVALAESAREEDVSLLFIDLDGFKSINDTLGHDAGDQLLMHAANQLLSATRTHDVVARLGGDEFVVLCDRTPTQESDAIADRIVSALREPIVLGGIKVTISASVGIISSNTGFTAAELLREADAAMYRAKLNGRDRRSR